MSATTTHRSGGYGPPIPVAECESCGWRLEFRFDHDDRRARRRALRHRCSSGWGYIRPDGEDNLWTVGRFVPGEDWMPHSDHGSEAEAQAEVLALREREPSGERLRLDV